MAFVLMVCYLSGNEENDSITYCFVLSLLLGCPHAFILKVGVHLNKEQMDVAIAYQK